MAIQTGDTATTRCRHIFTIKITVRRQEFMMDTDVTHTNINKNTWSIPSIFYFDYLIIKMGRSLPKLVVKGQPEAIARTSTLH
ncbi:MAG TPA: hypothetical protein DCY88_07965 [Cyanobacteria bacterium UBA11372]|nr:hypothetical protein [Cyanobacteria bacterium UBA11372]